MIKNWRKIKWYNSQYILLSLIMQNNRRENKYNKKTHKKISKL